MNKNQLLEATIQMLGLVNQELLADSPNYLPLHDLAEVLKANASLLMKERNDEESTQES